MNQATLSSNTQTFTPEDINRIAHFFLILIEIDQKNKTRAHQEKVNQEGLFYEAN